MPTIDSITDNGDATVTVVFSDVASGNQADCWVAAETDQLGVDWVHVAGPVAAMSGTFGPFALAPGRYWVRVREAGFLGSSGTVPIRFVVAAPISPAGSVRAAVTTTDAARWDVAIDDISCSCERPPGMAYNVHDLGDIVRVSASFMDAVTSAPIDPDTVTVAIKPPNGSVQDFVFGDDDEVERGDVGAYGFDVTATVSGVWFYRWSSTGDGQAAQERRFLVRQANAVIA